MEIQLKATSIDLFSLKTRQMRALHELVRVFPLLLCVVRDCSADGGRARELSLTKEQIGNTIIASVSSRFWRPVYRLALFASGRVFVTRYSWSSHRFR
ncbi:MAG: hypothetical protein H6821_05235 [Planctomycetaceae bacterium]|nr:hypothetical protein [Planctomycetaceae bacterium]